MIEEIIEKLEEKLDSDDFEYVMEDCMQELDESGAGITAVEPLLRLMERHSLSDFGMPGAIVRYAEQFYGRGYEDILASSVDRRPALHTVWMLNRIINAKEEETEKEKYENVMINILERPDVEDEIKNSVRELL